MFCGAPRLTGGFLFQMELSDDVVVDHTEFVSRLKKDMREAVQIADRKSRLDMQGSTIVQSRVRHLPFGDRMLVVNRGERGRRKVAAKWESTMYEAVAAVVHQHLLPSVNFLPIDDGQDSITVSVLRWFLKLTLQ